jgi:saccharopine dehydrogenase-like NADP-dependent oxidoreductase
MHRVLLLGAGKIGRMISRFLVDSGDYAICVSDVSAEALARLAQRFPQGLETIPLDAADHTGLVDAMRGRDAVISALSFHHNAAVARAALDAGASYFDLTEDIATTAQVRSVSERAKPGQVFMPQCGLAPGFISIVAAHLTTHFDSLDSVRMRVGALPQFPTGGFKYNLTWSTDGLINEYCNPCDAIHAGKRTELLPLEGYEHFSLDGVNYEAFSTSGGLGTLCETLDGRVRELNYKTVRYVGHRDYIAFLLNELRLQERRELLKEILETAVPVTFQDVVVTFCTVTGQRRGQFAQLTDARKVYHQVIGGEVWSAIQITTAAGICAVLDLHFAGKLPERGFVRQEQVRFDEFLANRFGRRYHADGASPLACDYSSGAPQ